MGYRISFRWTRQSSSIGCLVVQLRLDQLVIDVVDHRAQTLSTHGKKFCCPFMMDVAVAVHHAKFYQGHIDRRDIGVAVLRTTIPVLRQTQSPRFSLSDFLMLQACCMSCCYWMVMSIQSKPHSTSFQRGRRCRQRLIFRAAFYARHSILSIPHYPHVKEGAQRLRPGESTKARGASVEDKHPYTHQLNWITPGGYHYVW